MEFCSKKISLSTIYLLDDTQKIAHFFYKSFYFFTIKHINSRFTQLHTRNTLPIKWFKFKNYSYKFLGVNINV